MSAMTLTAPTIGAPSAKIEVVTIQGFRDRETGE